MSIPTIIYQPLTLHDITLTNDGRRGYHLAIGGDAIRTSGRFLQSLARLLGLPWSAIDRLTHISTITPADIISSVLDAGRLSVNFRLAIEQGENGPRALAASSHEMAYVDAADCAEALATGDLRAADVQYQDGVVRSVHAPRLGGESFSVGPETFSNRYLVCTPVDGYGKVSTYLGLHHERSGTTLLAENLTFRSQGNLGYRVSAKNPATNLAPNWRQLVETFNEEEGWSSLKDRIHAAQRAPASIAELIGFHVVLHQVLNSRPEYQCRAGALGRRLRDLVGNYEAYYGITNVAELPAVRQQRMPVQTTVFELLGFAMDVVHHVLTEAPEDVVPVNKWMADTLEDSYDLEGMLQAGEEVDDLFQARPVMTPTTPSILSSVLAA